MKAKRIDIGAILKCSAGAVLLMILFLMFFGCTTTKQVQQERIRQETTVKSSEEIKSSIEAQTDTKTKTTSKTEINEKCDSLVYVWVPVKDPKAGPDTVYEKVAVPIKFNRTIVRTEFQEQDQQKKEKENINVLKKDQLNQKSDVQTKEKTVERIGFPWWAYLLIIVVILAAVAILLWRMKVF